MNRKISFKILNISLLMALISGVFLSLASFDTSCEELRHNVLRLHIIANSNSDYDQQLKLKIRDEILKNSTDIFNNTENINDAILVANRRKLEFTQIAENVIMENGASYNVTAEIGDSYFETREYDDFTLPAGVYKSLIIKVGKAEGKNWWCVIFPEICVSTAKKGDLTDTVSQGTATVAKNPNRYVMRFKLIEIYEGIKNLIN